MPAQADVEALARQFGGRVRPAPVGPPAKPGIDIEALAAQLGGKSRSLEDTIKSIAQEHGVDPDLALAVARREATDPKTGQLNPNAVGDSGKAIGLFQMHSGAAQDTGVTDRNDPLQNITGGVRYLKQLHERYGGDRNKALMAYNGGMGNVDKGTISPAAQAYAADVIASLSQQTRQSAGRGRGAGPGQAGAGGRRTGAAAGPGPPEGAKKTDIGTPGTFLRSVTKPYDPRTPEGLENLAGMAGSIAIAPLTRGLPVGGFLPSIARGIAGIAGAATGGAAAAVTSGTDISEAAVRQGAYEGIGRTIMLPIVGVAKRLIAPRVANAASKGIEGEMDVAKEVGASTIQTVRNEIADAMRMLRQSVRAATRGVKETTSRYVEGAERFAAGQTDDATRRAAQTLADVELATADEVGRLTKQYDELLGVAPDPMAVHGAVAETLGGLPKTLHIPEGPAKRALDISGKRVEEAATGGPMINLGPLLEAARQMVRRSRPSFLKAGRPQPLQIGARPSGLPSGQRMSREEYEQLIRQETGLQESHPLPGLLGDFMSVPVDQMSYLDAHKFKVMLDSVVNWDRTAKPMLERFTKGLRTTIRRAMAGYAPYDDATAAYGAVSRLYTKGVGKKIIAAAGENPDAVAKMLDGEGVASAKALKQLLVDQAAAGGDVAAGKRAWDGVRSAYTYRKLLDGGVETLADRVKDLQTKHGAFAQEVYGDATGQQILSNFTKLGEAANVAQASGLIARKAAKTQGTKDVLEASIAAERGVGDARVLAERQQYTAAESARQQINAAQAAGRSRTQAAQAAVAQTAKGVEKKAVAFGDSSLRPYAGKRAKEEEFADAFRVLLLAPQGSYLSGLSLFRLISHPVKGKDLLQYIGYSKPLTDMYVRGLLGQLPAAGSTALIRELGAFAGLGPSKPPQEQATAP